MGQDGNLGRMEIQAGYFFDWSITEYYSFKRLDEPGGIILTDLLFSLQLFGQGFFPFPFSFLGLCQILWLVNTFGACLPPISKTCSAPSHPLIRTSFMTGYGAEDIVRRAIIGLKIVGLFVNGGARVNSCRLVSHNLEHQLQKGLRVNNSLVQPEQCDLSLKKLGLKFLEYR